MKNRSWVIAGIMGLACLGMAGCPGGGGTQEDPCLLVDCSGHGTCVSGGGHVGCLCDQGYHVEGLDCLPDPPDLCEGVVCSGHGICHTAAGLVRCICDAGYQDVGLDCIDNAVLACEGVTCSGHGICVAEVRLPLCRCEPGYRLDGLACVEIPPECLAIDCSGHGYCVVADGQPRCECEQGYAEHLQIHCAQVLDERICTPDGWCWQSPDFPFHSLRSIVSPQPGHAWFFGEGGFTLVWDGSRFSLPVPPPGIRSVNAAWAGAADDIWVVAGSRSAHWDGSIWREFTTGTSVDLKAVWGASPTEVWAAGDELIWDDEGSGHQEYTIIRWDGQAWRSTYTGWGSTCCLWGSSNHDVWAFGVRGMVLRWDGQTWTSVPVPEDVSIKDLWGSSREDLWVSSNRWI